jgi:hypothetical protein
MQVRIADEKFRSRLFVRHVMTRKVNHATRIVMNMNVESWRERGRTKKIWIDSARQDIRQLDVRDEMTTEREEWKRCCADSK